LNLHKKQSKSHSFILPVFRGKKAGGGDILCEMRFHVLNNELDAWHEQKDKEREEKEKEKKKGKDEESKDAKGSDDED
jgi:hypothetical protein